MRVIVKSPPAPAIIIRPMSSNNKESASTPAMDGMIPRMIHGLVWGSFAKSKFKSIDFGIHCEKQTILQK